MTNLLHVENGSRTDKEWDIDGKHYRELCRQEYQNCSFSTGEVTGHPVDTMYLRIERDGEHQMFLLLRPDEASAIAWVLTGAQWSFQISELSEDER